MSKETTANADETTPVEGRLLLAVARWIDVHHRKMPDYPSGARPTPEAVEVHRLLADLEGGEAVNSAHAGDEVGGRPGYRVSWLEEDGEWVGTSDEFPSLSHLAATPQAALDGVIRLRQGVMLDLAAKKNQKDSP